MTTVDGALAGGNANAHTSRIVGVIPATCRRTDTTETVVQTAWARAGTAPAEGSAMEAAARAAETERHRLVIRLAPLVKLPATTTGLPGEACLRRTPGPPCPKTPSRRRRVAGSRA